VRQRTIRNLTDSLRTGLARVSPSQPAAGVRRRLKPLQRQSSVTLLAPAPWPTARKRGLAALSEVSPHPQRRPTSAAAATINVEPASGDAESVSSPAPVQIDVPHSSLDTAATSRRRQPSRASSSQKRANGYASPPSLHTAHVAPQHGAVRRSAVPTATRRRLT